MIKRVQQAKEDLQEIIKSNVRLYSLIMDVSTKEYQSKTELYQNGQVYSDLRNFDKKINETDAIKNYFNCYISTVTTQTDDNDKNDKNDKNYNIVDLTLTADGSIEKNVYIRNTYTFIKSSITANGSNKTEYSFTTYCPHYMTFLFDNNKCIFANSMDFKKYNDLVDNAEASYNIINADKDSVNDEKTIKKILFSYLVERGCGLNYKFFLYTYVNKFVKELDELNIDEKKWDHLIKLYIINFSLFRDIYMFYNESFFENIHIIVSESLKSQQENVFSSRLILRREELPPICLDEIVKIADDLFEYQDELISDYQSNASQNTPDEYPFTFVKKLDEIKTKHSKKTDLWKKVQIYINMHISIDFEGDYFNILPHNNVQRYESQILNLEYNTGQMGCDLFASLNQNKEPIY